MTKTDIREKLTSAIALLNINGIGRGRYNKLVRKFGSAQAVLDASISKLEEVSGISHKVASAIKSEVDFEKAKESAAKVIQMGWGVMISGDESFPETLKNLSESDRPALLFYLGKDILEYSKMIAIVGSRHATEGGKRFAYKLASDLTKAGVTVVSGMAEGIDAFAHQGALDTGGDTIAIWGNSLEIVYPPSHNNLAERIKEQGTVISEYLPGTKPDRAHFPERNRLISALSEGVVVIEAGKKSGALITASEAVEQGREVFAVPGSPNSKLSEGCNQLIKKGAKLLTSVEDIFEELPRLKGEIKGKQFVKMEELTEMERKIVNLFQNGPQQVDKISRMTNLPVSELMEFLLALELKGVVQELSGKRYILTDNF